MLKKIQMKLNSLSEEREYVKLTKGQELFKNEDEQHKERREQKIKSKQAEDKRLQEERNEKNMERIRK